MATKAIEKVVWAMAMVRKPRSGPPNSRSEPTNSSSIEMPMTTSGITIGATTRLPNNVRPGKRGARTSA